MNDTRRKQLLKAVELLEAAQAIVEEVQEQEQEAHDNLPDNLQETELAEDIQENADDLQESYDDLDNIIESLCSFYDRALPVQL